MKNFKQLIMTVVLAFGLALPVAGLASTGTFAQNALESACDDAPESSLCDDVSESPTLGSVIKTVVNVLLFIVGAVSVVMIIIAGLRYVVSGGDSSAVSGAKNTILYSVIGLVVAFLAYAIVNWVLDIV